MSMGFGSLPGYGIAKWATLTLVCTQAVTIHGRQCPPMLPSTALRSSNINRHSRAMESITAAVNPSSPATPHLCTSFEVRRTDALLPAPLM